MPQQEDPSFSSRPAVCAMGRPAHPFGAAVLCAAQCLRVVRLLETRVESPAATLEDFGGNGLDFLASARATMSRRFKSVSLT